MKKLKFSRIAAAVGLFLLQPAFILVWVAKGLIVGSFIFLDPALRRKSVFFTIVKGPGPDRSDSLLYFRLAGVQ
jgi:hypothetical protein